MFKIQGIQGILAINVAPNSTNNFLSNHQINGKRHRVELK
jgi:hypothetical protein